MSRQESALGGRLFRAVMYGAACLAFWIISVFALSVAIVGDVPLDAPRQPYEWAVGLAFWSGPPCIAAAALLGFLRKSRGTARNRMGDR